MIMSYQDALISPAAPVAGELPVGEAPIRVMIVDDSAVVRGLVSRWLDEETGIEVVARHANGKLAVADVARSAPDIILLDVEMPVMDGLEALPLLLKERPSARVLMVSTLTKRNAEISFKALALGAIDYLPKPDSNSELTLSADFRGEVVRKVKALGRPRSHRARLETEVPDVCGYAGLTQGPAELGFSYRPFSLVPPRVIAIGSSTGGPEVLVNLLGLLSPALSRVPVVIAQHMPPVFTAILAERLAKASRHEAREGKNGEPVRPGTIYVAPGGHHMTVVRATSPVLRIGDEPPLHFCRPAVDPLFRSVAATFGPASLGIVLTGMGHDAAAGARSIAEAGGSVIAQDESSSVVWGMPGAAAAVGACSALLPPAAIAETTAKLVRGVRP
ncbi:MAG TPA: chemotaxis response regulator protein-glutamate methylesterase [Methyloceanibacter sp.]|nr:chemotaxis response regulator protein-glutamate methylesterase [Methyloceanibacter sp.]